MSGRVELIKAILKCYETPSYLEIGFGNGFCFNSISVEDKTCVDPHPVFPETWATQGNCILKTSDDFFSTNDKMYDVIFIDGDHDYSAVKSDFENATRFLKEGGTIILHDCNPLSEWMCRPKEEFFPEKGEAWNGGGYRLFMEMYQTTDKFTWMTSHEDHGCCVVRRGKRTPVVLDTTGNTSYELFDKNRQEILNLMAIDRIIENCCNGIQRR